jgi:hypothetical protein
MRLASPANAVITAHQRRTSARRRAAALPIISNRHFLTLARLETPLSHRKQKPETISNRHFWAVPLKTSSAPLASGPNPFLIGKRAIKNLRKPLKTKVGHAF